VFIGLVAAIIVLAMNPPGSEWPALVGSALAAGLGGEAILLAIISARRAQASEIAKKQARADEKRAREDGARRIETMGEMSVSGLREQAARPGFADTVDATHEPSLAAAIETFARRAAQELRSPMGGQVRATILSILQKHLRRSDVEDRPLGEIGGDDPGIRRLIARDILRAYPDLTPPWTVDDVTADSTLDSLANDVDGRL
jgi:hypothetical protein